ncbi:MAG: hypothetical protein V4660_01265 [Pseudomonadota bacterium]
MINAFVRKLCWLIPALLCCAVAIFFGKDINFDAVNYHGYVAFALFEGRLNTDFFPAGPQSYLNPVGYIPFYLLTLLFDDIGVSIGLALIHSACIYGLIFLTRELICRHTHREAYFLAIILSMLTTVFWQVVGSTFIDAHVGALVLFGLVYLIRWCKDLESSPGNKNISVSAFLFGFACGLKLTAIIYAVGAGIIAFVLLALYRNQWKQFILFVLVGVGSFMLVEGWWAYFVYQRTGNPFFPYFNHIFASPLYPAVSITNTRFIPEGLMEGLLLPLRAAMPLPWLYQELRSPDIRLFVIFALMIGGMVFFRHKLKSSFSGMVAICFFVISYIFWLITSGNGRYAVALFLMVGVLIAWALVQLCRQSLAKNILLGLVFLQFTIFYVGGNFRWSDQTFSDDWFGYEIPEKLLKEPALYLTLHKNSFSFLASKVHPLSAFANLSGQLALPLSGELQTYLTDAEDKVSGRVRFVESAMLEPAGVITDKDLPTIDGYQLRSRLIYVMNSRFSRFGYEVDKTDCVFISQGINPAEMNSKILFSCGLKKNLKTLESFNKNVSSVDIVFNAIEAKCFGLFDPRVSFTEKYGDLWRRDYTGSEVMMYLSAGSVWLSFSDRIGVLRLGAFDELVNGVEGVKCDNDLVRVSNDL